MLRIEHSGRGYRVVHMGDRFSVTCADVAEVKDAVQHYYEGVCGPQCPTCRKLARRAEERRQRAERKARSARSSTVQGA